MRVGGGVLWGPTDGRQLPPIRRAAAGPSAPPGRRRPHLPRKGANMLGGGAGCVGGGLLGCVYWEGGRSNTMDASCHKVDLAGINFITVNTDALDTTAGPLWLTIFFHITWLGRAKSFH